MRSGLRTAALSLAVVCVGLVWGCPTPPPPPVCVAEDQACTEGTDCCEGLECINGVCVPSGVECAAENDACAEVADCCEGLVCAANVCVVPGTGGTAALPAKSIALDLIGIHDPDSISYDSNCTDAACHGDRTIEVALDGVTPAAHATMLAQFGEGNDRCIACHESGPNFLTLSQGALREQIDMEQQSCALGPCHGPNAPDPLYVRP